MSQLGSSDSDASMGTGSTTPAASIILASPSAEIEWLEARIANRKQKEAHQAKREEMLQWMLEQAEDGRADIWQQLAVATYDWEQLQANLQTLYQHNTSMMVGLHILDGQRRLGLVPVLLVLQYSLQCPCCCPAVHQHLPWITPLTCVPALLRTCQSAPLLIQVSTATVPYSTAVVDAGTLPSHPSPDLT